MSIKGRRYHEERGNDPIDKDTEQDLDPDLTLPERKMQSLILDFTEYGIHHDKQPDGFLGCQPVSEQEGTDGRSSKRTYGYRYTDEFALLKRRTGVGDEIAQQDANQHREEDP